MKKPPRGWPRLSPALFYDDAPRAIDWLCKAFGFEIQLKVEGEPGTIVHSQLVFDDALIMVSTAAPKGGDEPRLLLKKSPRALGGATTQSLMIYVDDVEAHCARARAAGAIIDTEPKISDYGDDYWVDKSYGAVDPEGHHWWFSERISTGKTAPQ
jgi:uncharacterized glyoxalase superfamily protein PhnB